MSSSANRFVGQTSRSAAGLQTRPLLLIILILAATLSAQDFRGSLVGTVHDATGAVIQSADLSLHSAGPSLDRQTKTVPAENSASMICRRVTID